MLSSSCFTEKGIESIVTSTYSLIAWHLPISLKQDIQKTNLNSKACEVNITNRKYGSKLQFQITVTLQTNTNSKACGVNITNRKYGLKLRFQITVTLQTAILQQNVGK
jgi:hypothetical protein